VYHDVSHTGILKYIKLWGNHPFEDALNTAGLKDASHTDLIFLHTFLLKCIILCGNHHTEDASHTARMLGTQKRILPTGTRASHIQH